MVVALYQMPLLVEIEKGCSAAIDRVSSTTAAWRMCLLQRCWKKLDLPLACLVFRAPMSLI